MIEVKQIKKKFGRKNVLSGITFTAEKGANHMSDRH